MPDLHFRVEGAEVLEFAAVPTLLFKLRLENREGEPVRSACSATRLIGSTSTRFVPDCPPERRRSSNYSALARKGWCRNGHGGHSCCRHTL